MTLFLFGKVLQGDAKVFDQERLERLVNSLSFPLQAIDP